MSQSPSPTTAAANHHSLSPSKKPLPWTHQETLNLIRAYQEKWYSLKRGQLKASQWEEVAVSVAAFCRLDEPSKSATQCRHKIEKLRKRHRSEKQKPYPTNSSWVYFDLMDRLERGPLPIEAKPPPNYCSGSDEDESRLWGCHPDVTVLPTPNNGLQSASRQSGAWKDPDVITAIPLRRLEFGSGNTAKKRKFYEEAERRGEEEDDYPLELAGEMREFAESYVKMERKKMEVMRENERFRMEMENKRLEMILLSHQKTVQIISNAFNSSPRNNTTQDL